MPLPFQRYCGMRTRKSLLPILKYKRKRTPKCEKFAICYGYDLCEADKLCEDLWFFQKPFKFYQFIADLDVNFDSTIQFKSLNMNKRRTFCTIRFGADLRVCKQHMVMQVEQKWNINVNELKKRCYNFCKWLQTENESQSQRMYRC